MNENIPTPVCESACLVSHDFGEVVPADTARELERRAIQAEHGLLEAEKCVQHLTKRVESLLVPVLKSHGEKIDRIARAYIG